MKPVKHVIALDLRDRTPIMHCHRRPLRVRLEIARGQKQPAVTRMQIHMRPINAPIDNHNANTSTGMHGNTVEYCYGNEKCKRMFKPKSTRSTVTNRLRSCTSVQAEHVCTRPIRIKHQTLGFGSPLMRPCGGHIPPLRNSCCSKTKRLAMQPRDGTSRRHADTPS